MIRASINMRTELVLHNKLVRLMMFICLPDFVFFTSFFQSEAKLETKEESHLEEEGTSMPQEQLALL